MVVSDLGIERQARRQRFSRPFVNLYNDDNSSNNIILLLFYYLHANNRVDESRHPIGSLLVNYIYIIYICAHGL